MFDVGVECGGNPYEAVLVEAVVWVYSTHVLSEAPPFGRSPKIPSGKFAMFSSKYASIYIALVLNSYVVRFLVCRAKHLTFALIPRGSDDLLLAQL